MIRRSFLLLALLCGPGLTARAADPVVSNVALAQRTDGSGLADITYDLANADGGTAGVAVRFSDDGGATWDFPPLNLSGDIGAAVPIGTGRHIVWDAGALPELPVMQDLRVRVIANDNGISLEPHSPGLVAITDFGTVDWSDPAVLDLYARADFLQLMGSNIWTGGDAGTLPVIAGLKARNPDLKTIAYVSVKSAQTWAANPASNPFWHEWWVRTEPYQVRTTTGEIASDFPGNVLINILDPDCRRAMIEVITEFHRNSINQVDGLYWDYFNNAIWVHPDVAVSGEPDFDGDGIGHDNDPDERIAYRAAQVALVTAMRDSMGEDFIQLFNGQRAYSDSTFAALADGAMYELFPTLFFPDPDMQYALDPAYPFSLFHAPRWFRTGNGGPYVVLANTWQNWYQDHTGTNVQLVNGNQYRAVALLTDTYASWNTNDLNPYSNTYGWTDNDISLGEPLGPPTFDGNFIRRDFRYGRVEVEMTSGRYPDPFDYRIWSFGQLVEELRIPFHHP